MSTNGRIALIVAAVVVALAAFIVVQSGGTDSTSSATAQLIRVRDGKPVGGVEKIAVHKGDTLRLTVSSPDTAQEIHVHGYDLTGDAGPGKPAEFKFKTDIEGAFEIELEKTGTKIASLQVQPR